MAMLLFILFNLDANLEAKGWYGSNINAVFDFITDNAAHLS